MPAAMVLGVLVAQGAPELTLTETDALWLARAIVGEEGRPADGGASVTRGQALAIASTMLRRWAAVNADRQRRGQGPAWRTLTALLAGDDDPTDGRSQPRTGYSNPVQEWLRNTGTEAERARRAQVAGMAWDEVAEPVRRAVLDILSGRQPLTESGSGAVHFAAPRVVAEKLARNPDWKRVPAPSKNWLVSDSIGRALRCDPVVRGAFSVGSAIGFASALAALIGSAA